MHGHAGHRAADAAMSQVLSNLGYGEGVALFEEAVRGWHDDNERYPKPLRRSIRCRLGMHRMIYVPSQVDFVWLDYSTCARCGKSDGSNPCP